MRPIDALKVAADRMLDHLGDQQDADGAEIFCEYVEAMGKYIKDMLEEARHGTLQ